MTIQVTIDSIRTADAGTLAWGTLADRVRCAVQAYAWTGRTGKSDNGPSIGLGARAIADIEEATAEALARAVAWADENPDAPFGDCVALAIGTGRMMARQAAEGRLGGRRAAALAMDPADLPEGESDAADQAMQDREAAQAVTDAIDSLSANHRATVLRLIAEEGAPADCGPDAWRRRVCDARRAMRAALAGA
jgi:hypothetical protein